MIATAYTRLSDPFEKHSDVPGGNSKPTRVVMVTSEGAHLADDLPEGAVTLYDIVTYEDRVKTEYILVGWEDVIVENTGDDEVESERVEQRPIYETIEAVDRVKILETFAVSTPVS